MPALNEQTVPSALRFQSLTGRLNIFVRKNPALLETLMLLARWT